MVWFILYVSFKFWYFIVDKQSGLRYAWIKEAITDEPWTFICKFTVCLWTGKWRHHANHPYHEIVFCGADCLGKTIIGGENAKLKMLFLCGRSVCCKILCQIGDWVGRDGETVRVKRYSRWIRRINAPAVIHKILSERTVFDFLGRCVSDELAHNRADNLQMRQFLRTYVGEQPLCYLIGHWIPLGKIAQRCPEFAIRSTVL